MNKNFTSENISKKIKYAKDKYSYLIKPLIIIFVIFLFSIYPILRANFNYVDDLGRVAEGYRGFTNYSRYGSEYLSILVHTSDYLTDISPLPQILAIILISLSCIVVVKLFNDNKITFAKIVSVIPIGLSPYFLECLSYKYDSIYMALSVFVCIIPFIFYGSKRKDKIIFSIALIIGTIMMCATYQASSGIVPLMALFLAFKYWNNKQSKDAIHILLLSALNYVIGLLIYRFFIMTPIQDYASTYMASFNKLIPTFLSHLLVYYKNLLSDFRTIWKVLIVVILLCFIINNTKNTKQNKFMSFLLCIILLVLCGLLVFGVYPVLEKPIFAPRSMYGIGVLIALICVNITKFDKAYLSKTIIFALSYTFITFSFTYGNALSQQKRYIDFRTEAVINELNKIEIMNNDETKYIYLTGTIGNAPEIENLPKDYSVLINRLIQQTFSGNVYVWDVYYFKNYFKIKNIKMVFPDPSFIPENLETFCDTMYYSIKTNNTDFILINLK